MVKPMCYNKFTIKRKRYKTYETLCRNKTCRAEN